MKKFKVTYIEGNTINKTAIVEGNTFTEAMTIFLSKNVQILDVTKVEEVKENA